MEILAPAGSPEALYAAVYAGADAVYFGSEGFNARKNAKNFTREQSLRAIDFCRERGVKTCIALNTLVSSRELPQALEEAEFFARGGASEFIVQDLGLFTALKRSCNVPLCASTQLSCHSLDGACALVDMGFSRIVLARELEKRDIVKIARGTRGEIEVFAHGALCMCYSGQCYMSSVIGGRSGNRGLCAQPCRLPYEGGYRLSLKDLCLLEYVRELEDAGVACLKIEGRMKSPEYVYSVVRAYADAKKGKPYSPTTEAELARVFSRDGFTRGYYMGAVGRDMFGVRRDTDKSAKVIIEQKEYKRLGLSVFARTQADKTLEITLRTEDGFAAQTSLPGQTAQSPEAGRAALEQAFSRLGNTPYFLKETEQTGEPVFVPLSQLNGARRELLSDIAAMRRINSNFFKPVSHEAVADSTPGEKKTPLKAEKRLEGVFLSAEQLPKNAELLSAIWLPLEVVCSKKGIALTEKYPCIGAVMPRVYEDRESDRVEELLSRLKERGISKVLSGNIGQVAMLLRRGFTVHGDFGLNVFNDLSADTLRKIGLSSLTLSFELNMAQLGELSGEDTGIIAYGRLPFMIMRNCIKKQCRSNELLADRMNKKLLLTCAFGCRNELYNADKLWLADKMPELPGFLRLLFTDEAQAEAEAVINAYARGVEVEREGITRGLYYKKV